MNKPNHQATGGHEQEPVFIGEPMSLDLLHEVACLNAPVALCEKGAVAIAKGREVVDACLVKGAPATYGINTGFGALAEVRVPLSDPGELQHRLLRSHAVGVGAALDRAQTRALMLLRAQVLAWGYSGVRRDVVDQLVALLNAGVHPVIPSQGSVGACGDLAPLAHLALVLIGEGEAEFDGKTLSGEEALRAANITPLRLMAKEGLSLINGTQGMLAVGGLALRKAEILAKTADVTGAMSLDALKGTDTAFDPDLIAARPHPGAVQVAQHLQQLLKGSAILASHLNCPEVQDAYSLRCMPQIHGSARDLLTYVRNVVDCELNAVTDNPLVLDPGRIVSGGNFHGQPVAAAFDVATLGITDLCSAAERRVAQLVDPSTNRGLPPFLALNSGLNSGFMMAQVTMASLVGEARALSVPKSVDSIPTSADREDHVSMGMTAARYFSDVVQIFEHALSIEAVVAHEGIRQRELDTSPALAAVRKHLAAHIAPIEQDRAFHKDFEAARQLIASGKLLEAADQTITP